MPSPVHPYSDYGVALRTLRSARAWLAWLLAFCVVMQMVGFTLMRYTQQPYKSMKPAMETGFIKLQRKLNPTMVPTTEAATAPATGPATQLAATPATTAPSIQAAATQAATLAETDYMPPLSAEGRHLNIREQWNTTYVMAVAATQVGGLLSAASQTLIVFLTLLVILVAQAPGVAHVTRALIWAVILLFMVMPWQFFARDFPIPGVMYGYQELLSKIGPQVVVGEQVSGFERLVVLGRFVIYPMAALFFLLMMSERFRAGLMLAIGHPLQSIMQTKPNLAGAAAQPKATPALEKKPG